MSASFWQGGAYGSAVRTTLKPTDVGLVEGANEFLANTRELAAVFPHPLPRFTRKPDEVEGPVGFRAGETV